MAALTHGGRVDNSQASRYVRNTTCADCRTLDVACTTGPTGVAVCWSCEIAEWTRIANNPHFTSIYRDFARNNARRMNRGLEPKAGR